MDRNEESIAARLARLRERMTQAAQRAGRNPNEITLVAVTKTVPVARIAEAYAAGARDFGENYVQEALGKLEQPPMNAPDTRLHFIGHLQRNKAKPVAERFHLIHSVDSIGLATELGKRAASVGRRIDILLEVKLDPIETKFGFALEDIPMAAEQAQALSGVRLQGLMGMAPYATDPEAARPHFRALRRQWEQLPPTAQGTLSMGMTNDFEVAIEEGATLVRIGTAIFGAR